MGFLEALGRSQAITKGFKDYEDIKTSQIERGFKEKQLEVANMQMEDIKKQREWNESLTPLDIFSEGMPGSEINLSPSQSNWLTELAQIDATNSGFQNVGGRFVVKKGWLKNTYKDFKESAPLQLFHANLRLTDKAQQANNIKTQIQAYLGKNPNASIDETIKGAEGGLMSNANFDEKLKKLYDQFTKFNTEYNGLLEHRQVLSNFLKPDTSTTPFEAYLRGGTEGEKAAEWQTMGQTGGQKIETWVDPAGKKPAWTGDINTGRPPTGYVQAGTMPMGETKENLKMSDVTSAFNIELNTIKNQMMLEMTPEETQQLAGQPAENILTMLLSGRVGKAIPKEKRDFYLTKLKEINDYYTGLSQKVLGRKGVTESKPESKTKYPEGISGVPKRLQGESIEDYLKRTGK